MRKIVLTGLNKIIAWLLAILGFTPACEKLLPRCEYGTPYAEYIIKGKIIDKETKKPIKDIRVTLKESQYTFTNSAVRTQSDGTYILKYNNLAGTKELKILAEDLDGTKNGGSFAADSISIKELQMKKTGNGDGNWKTGIYEASNANFSLKYAPLKK